MSNPTPRPPADLKSRIEKVLSEILSDKYGCKITLHFERKERTE
jgi:hypothetical protein